MVEVPAAAAEVAADVLWSLGVVAVEERDGADGRIELWTSIGEGSLGDDRRATAVLERDGWTWRFVEIDESVSDGWRSHAAAVEPVPGIVIRPAWVPFAPAPGQDVVVIEPGSSFGLGDHPTTRLCVRALAGHVRRGDRVLDVGCGSGVLSVLARRLGAGVVTAVDIAPAAVEATLDNARRNDVHVDVSCASLESLDGDFDVVVANILAPVLIELAPQLRRLTRRVLLLSGVLEGRFDHVVEALAPMAVVDIEILDGWAMVALRGCAPSALGEDRERRIAAGGAPHPGSGKGGGAGQEQAAD